MHLIDLNSCYIKKYYQKLINPRDSMNNNWGFYFNKFSLNEYGYFVIFIPIRAQIIFF